MTAFGAVISASARTGTNGTSLPFVVEYGTDTNYGQTSASRPSGGSVTLSHLQPSTIYHFRIYVEDSQGTLTGSDQILITSFSLDRRDGPRDQRQ